MIGAFFAIMGIMQDPTDNLSATGRQLLHLARDTDTYAQLVVKGSGNEQARIALEGVIPEDLVTGSFKNRDETRGLLAALWLWYDWLDASHDISQQIHTPTGSFWHAIMHRREGDFSNSKYWYAKCASHPILASLGIQGNSIIHPLPADKALLKVVVNGWNANAFVDFVEAVHREPEDARYSAAVQLQRLEWKVLFDYGVRVAVAGNVL